MRGLLRKIFQSPAILLAIIVVVALISRLIFMWQITSLTFDEIASVSIATKPLSQIWSYLRWEMSPPLHFYFLHFWFGFFGYSEISARLSSVITSLFAVVALYFLGKELFGSRRSGLYASFLYSGSVLFSFYGFWSRMYSMLFLFSTLSFLFFIKLVRSGRGEFSRNAIFYSLFTVAALYTHLTAGLIVVIQIVYLAYILFRREAKFLSILKRFSISWLVIILLYGPWFIYFAMMRLSGLQGNAWYFIKAGAPSFFGFIIYDLFKYLTISSSFFTDLLAFSMIAVFGFLAIASIEKTEKFWKLKLRFSSAHFLALAILLVSILGLYFVKLFPLRYAFVPAIGLFLLLGNGMARSGRLTKIIITILFIVMSAFGYLEILNFKSATQWKNISTYIEEEQTAGDKIVTCLNFCILPLSMYYHGGLPIKAPLDESMREKDDLATVLKTNIYPTTTEENVNQLAGFIGDAKRIFFVVSDGDGAFAGSSKITHNYLLSHGFKIVGSWPGTIGDSIGVWVLEKTN